MWRGLSILLVCVAGCGGGSRSLAIGSAAPDFSLPGIDGKTHSLAEYAPEPCARGRVHLQSLSGVAALRKPLRKLDEDYRAKGVTLVAINSDRADAIPLSDLAYSDVGDSLAGHEGSRRASPSRVSVSVRWGDASRSPRNSASRRCRTCLCSTSSARCDTKDGSTTTCNESLVKIRDARNAIDAMLADRACAGRADGGHRLHAASGIEDVAAAGGAGQDRGRARARCRWRTKTALKKLRTNPTGKLLLVNFWATWCGPCVTEFPELENTYRMYRNRGFDFVSVSANDPGRQTAGDRVS